MSLTVKKDNYSRLLHDVQRLTGQEVLIGVPYENAPRNSSEDESSKETPITNAVIGYVHEFGAPEVNIPARPHLIPGVRRAKSEIIEALRSGIQQTLRGKKDVGRAALERAGFAAKSSVKRMITDGLSPHLSPRTIEERHRQRGTASKCESELMYEDLIRSGVSPATAQQSAEIKALINTGEYLRSITHVVRSRK